MVTKDILREAMQLLSTEEPKNKLRNLLEYLAFRTKIDPQLPVNSNLTFLSFMDEHWPDICMDQGWQEEYLYDPITELGEELGVFPKLLLTKEDAAEYAQSITLPAKRTILPPRVHDDNCSTGRRLLACFYRFGDDAVYTGMESHTWSFRICTLNMYFHNVPSRILWTRPVHLEPDVYVHDWGWAGQWVIPKMAVLQQRDEAI